MGVFCYIQILNGLNLNKKDKYYGKTVIINVYFIENKSNLNFFYKNVLLFLISLYLLEPKKPKYV
ncbi:MAG TPA: hypothetical protein DCM10_20800 [Xanthomarina gelatinilytica]|nr:hypothetical protein [Xanthomarina gelatinilytica]